jgi:drug/metabolite transporter (DMT)-like permease
MPIRVIGLVILVVGVVLLVFGFNASDAPVEQARETLTGKYSDSTMLYIILGAVGVVLGGLMAMMRRSI